MITIIFESHGTTTDNENHIASGHHDVALSPLGEQQAKELGERYKDDSFAAIFCSDLQRSYKTAEIAFAGRNFLIIKDARLRECDYGDWTRQPSAHIEAERGKRISQPFPNGESYEQAAARMKSFLNDLDKKYDGQKIMIIGHRATQYGLEHWVNDVPLQQIVTAPWQWQAGWEYNLKTMTKPQEISACVFLYNEEHKLFIAKRAATKKFLPNKYELIGGRIEYGETMAEGLQRECREELHVEINLEEPFYAFTYMADDVHTVEVIYFATLKDNSQKIHINLEDHSESRWIYEAEIDTFLPADDQETRAVRRGFVILQ